MDSTNIAIFVCIYLCVFTMIISQEDDKTASYLHLKKRRNKVLMKEALKEILGEECIVTTLKGDKTGKLIEISDGCLVIENKQTKEYVNLEFVISAKKHPVNKNGKKKMIVL